MSFWTENTTEPKRNFRWRVTLGGAFAASASGGIVWWAKTVDTPSFTVTDVTHSFFDNEYKFPGRVQWQDVNMTLVDPISPNAVQMTNQIILNSGYSVKGSQEFGQNPTSITKVGANSAMGNVLIEILKGDGTPVETWTLNNPFITSVKFSTLDYTNDDMRTIDLTLKYDWANCLHPDNKFGDQIQFPKPGEQ
jgi:hypothetical protein